MLLLSQFVASLGLENMGLTLMSDLLFQSSDTLGKESRVTSLDLLNPNLGYLQL